MNSERLCDGKRSAATAFSLVELLVVIAIIALLVGLLLPALSGTQRVTQTAACKSRLRQVGMALALYTADFGVYPNAIEKLDRYLAPNRQVGRTNRESAGRVGRSPLLFCPTKVVYWLNLYGSLSWPQGPQATETNASLGLSMTCPTDPVYGPYLPENSILVPSETFSSGDTMVSGWPDEARDPFFLRGMHFRPQYAHRPNRDYPDVGIANMLFCDGHVDDGRRFVWEAHTDAARRRWNRDHRPHNEHFAP